jgi:hypothetical protein
LDARLGAQFVEEDVDGRRLARPRRALGHDVEGARAPDGRSEGVLEALELGLAVEEGLRDVVHLEDVLVAEDRLVPAEHVLATHYFHLAVRDT